MVTNHQLLASDKTFSIAVVTFPTEFHSLAGSGSSFKGQTKYENREVAMLLLHGRETNDLSKSYNCLNIPPHDISSSCIKLM
jgi:hypothetical protein